MTDIGNDIALLALGSLELNPDLTAGQRMGVEQADAVIRNITRDGVDNRPEGLAVPAKPLKRDRKIGFVHKVGE